MSRVREHFHLHELAIEDIQLGEERPKIQEFGDSLFFVMHLATLVEGELHVGEAFVFVGPDYVVSTRNRTDRSLLGVRARAESEPHLLRQGPVYVAYALLDTVCDGYFPVLEALEMELERLEAQIFTSGQPRETLQQLYTLKHQVGQLRHTVRPLMEAVSKLHGGRVPALVAPMQDYFRDVYDHLYRIQAGIDAMRDTIATAIQVNLSLVTIEEGEINKRLAAWAAIIAVIPSMAAVWGMNFQAMPELSWEWGYPAALALMLLGSSFLYWRFKKAKWL
jgi:magnesium transporter